jgi:hypothetical protein
VSHVAEFYGCISRGDVKQAVETLLGELYFSTEFERDNGDNWYTVEDNDTYNAEAHYKFCPRSRLCHIQIVATNSQALRGLTQAFANSADEYFEYWHCVSDTVGSEHSQRSFRRIHEIENGLRVYIFKKLVLTHGANWEDHLGLDNSKLGEARRRQARALDAGTGEYVANLNILFYLDFYDIIEILRTATDDGESPNELFSETLIGQSVDELHHLRTIRNNMAHNRFLTQAEFQKVNQEATAIQQALKEDTKGLLSL